MRRKASKKAAHVRRAAADGQDEVVEAATQRALQVATADPLRPDHLGRLQRSAGNNAVTSLVRDEQAAPPGQTLLQGIPPAGDRGAAGHPRIAPALAVQRRGEDEPELDAPYQSKMDPKSSTLVTDQLGNAAAASATPASLPVEARVGKPSFGMLTPAQFPLEPSLRGQAYFRNEMERTLKARIYGHTGPEEKKKTFSYRSLNVGLGRYAMDSDLIPKAEQAFNIFVPLANAAARAVVKADSVAQDLWINEEGWDVSQDLSKGEQSALREAMRRYQISNDQVSGAIRDLRAQRTSLAAASRGMARLTQHGVIKKLRAEQDKASADKEAIEAKIAKIAKVAGYVQTGVSVVAGGSTKLISLASTAAPDVETDPAKRIKGAADKVNKATSMLGKAATFGMELYYDKELTELKAKIATLGSAIEHHADIEDRNKWEQIKISFDAAMEKYANAVTSLENALDDRRETMAMIGAEADRLAKGRNKGDDRGHDSDIASRTLLFATTIMETKALISAATDAGSTADEEVGRAYSHIQSWRGGYGKGFEPDADSPDPFYYQRAQDIWSNQRRIEGLKGEDFKAIAKARRQLQSWTMGAEAIVKVLDSWLGSDGPKGTGIKKLLGDAQWSGGEY